MFILIVYPVCVFLMYQSALPEKTQPINYNPPLKTSETFIEFSDFNNSYNIGNLLNNYRTLSNYSRFETKIFINVTEIKDGTLYNEINGGDFFDNRFICNSTGYYIIDSSIELLHRFNFQGSYINFSIQFEIFQEKVVNTYWEEGLANALIFSYLVFFYLGYLLMVGIYFLILLLKRNSVK